MANPWLIHLKRTMHTHPGKKMTRIIKLAKKTYKKKGGGKYNKKKIKNKKKKHAVIKIRVAEAVDVAAIKSYNKLFILDELIALY